MKLLPLVPQWKKSMPQLLQMQIVGEIEVLVVNDGSTDDTAAVAQAAGARVVHHPYSKGNGAAIKTGARSALGEVLVFMDADGQHDPADIPRLLNELNQGNDMVVGARHKRARKPARGRGLANGLYNRLASRMTGHKAEDLDQRFLRRAGRQAHEFLPPAQWLF
ncbi:MAG: glycosyltransferase family 2 protein [Paenacidovorax caeni]